MIKNRISIDDRPEIIDQKTRIGDWKGDTVIGKNHKGGLVTPAERKSRYVLAGHIRGTAPFSPLMSRGENICVRFTATAYQDMPAPTPYTVFLLPLAVTEALITAFWATR